MSTLSRAKIVLALAGLAVFGAGVRLEHAGLRYIGIALVAAAWLLRFAKRRGTEAGQVE